MWLAGRLAPDHKTIADFRKNLGPAIQQACAQFVGLCRDLGLFSKAIVALDGSKFKAVNSRDNNFTINKVAKRIEQAEINIARYLTALERADRQGGEIAEARTPRLKEKIERLRRRIEDLRDMGKRLETAPGGAVSLTVTDTMRCRLDQSFYTASALSGPSADTRSDAVTLYRRHASKFRLVCLASFGRPEGMPAMRSAWISLTLATTLTCAFPAAAQPAEDEAKVRAVIADWYERVSHAPARGALVADGAGRDRRDLAMPRSPINRPRGGAPPPTADV